MGISLGVERSLIFLEKSSFSKKSRPTPPLWTGGDALQLAVGAGSVSVPRPHFWFFPLPLELAAAVDK
jgi:hypothetical protein